MEITQYRAPLFFLNFLQKPPHKYYCPFRMKPLKNDNKFLTILKKTNNEKNSKEFLMNFKILKN